MSWPQGAPYILNGLGVRPEVYESAMTYIRIRQLFCPLVLVCSIAQSAHLASKDVYTPLKLVILSGCINCLGDMLLVGKLGLGVAGAAWATVASQFALVGGLLLSLRRAGKLPSLLPLPRLREYEPFVDFAKGITMINLLRVRAPGTRAITHDHAAKRPSSLSSRIALSTTPYLPLITPKSQMRITPSDSASIFEIRYLTSCPYPASGTGPPLTNRHRVR